MQICKSSADDCYCMMALLLMAVQSEDLLFPPQHVNTSFRRILAHCSALGGGRNSARMCVCMYLCVYVCMYVCMYVRTYVRMSVGVYVCMYVCAYVYMFVCMYVRMYVRAYVYLFVCMYTCMHVHMYTYIRPCTYACTYTPVGSKAIEARLRVVKKPPLWQCEIATI